MYDYKKKELKLSSYLKIKLNRVIVDGRFEEEIEKPELGKREREEPLERPVDSREVDSE